MKHKNFRVGDVVELHQKYEETAKIALIIQIRKSEFCGKDGWISFDFTILNEVGQLIHVSESCIKNLVSTNQSPSTWLHLNYSSN